MQCEHNTTHNTRKQRKKLRGSLQLAKTSNSQPGPRKRGSTKNYICLPLILRDNSNQASQGKSKKKKKKVFKLCFLPYYYLKHLIIHAEVLIRARMRIGLVFQLKWVGLWAWFHHVPNFDLSLLQFRTLNTGPGFWSLGPKCKCLFLLSKTHLW